MYCCSLAAYINIYFHIKEVFEGDRYFSSCVFCGDFGRVEESLKGKSHGVQTVGLISLELLCQHQEIYIKAILRKAGGRWLARLESAADSNVSVL